MKKKIVDFIKKLFKKPVIASTSGKISTANLTGTSGLKVKTGNLEEPTEEGKKTRRVARKTRRKKK